MDFWSDRIWLPGDITWDDIDQFESAGNSISKVQDLYIVPLYACVLLILRYIFEATLGTWLAQKFKIRNVKKIVPVKNATLEAAYAKNRKLTRDTTLQLLKELDSDWTERKVERWFRHKRNLAKLPAVRKFTETFWRFAFYTIIYTYGTVTLLEQPWFTNHDHCWTDYPLQVMPNSSKGKFLPFYRNYKKILVYYFAELSFYLSLAMTLLWDNKRKDFNEQIVHHIATLLLLSKSFLVPFYTQLF